jgi:AcrR family transcriptional regulator
MARPSRNVDQLLIQAAFELLPETGVRGLSMRRVAELAGVNLGMFHYHFKTKEAFVRAVLQHKYNAMFESLEVNAKSSAHVLENLRAGITVLARFTRDNRVLLVRLMGDALAGEQVAVDFIHANVPRHIAVISALLTQAQQEKVLKKMPLPQALAFLVGAVASPILAGAAVMQGGLAPPALSAALEQTVLTDAAVDARINMALAGMAAGAKQGG